MNTDNIHIRSIRSADNSQVADLIKSVMTEFGCVGEGYSINDAEVEQMYEAYLPERHGFWVIESDDKILGCGGIGQLAGADNSVCELKKMYFYPELRGLGWGKRLLEHCLHEAKQFGYQSCYLETVDQMVLAIGLYEKFGFKRIEGPLGQTGHCSCDKFFMLEFE